MFQCRKKLKKKEVNFFFKRKNKTKTKSFSFLPNRKTQIKIFRVTKSRIEIYFFNTFIFIVRNKKKEKKGEWRGNEEVKEMP